MATLEDAIKHGGVGSILTALSPNMGPLGAVQMYNMAQKGMFPGLKPPGGGGMLNVSPPNKDPIQALGEQYDIGRIGNNYKVGNADANRPSSSDVNSFVSALLGNIAPSIQPRGGA